MESPRKNNDCYFYYYSTCTKGDSCTFRHEPSALGCETTCSFWKEGKCINVRCNFRHMELRKNRKVIPCYWESQPGGCLKPHCPFLHQNPKHPSLSENQGETSDIKTQDLNKGTAIQNTDSCSKNVSQGNEKNFGSPVVDPLVVNFEEESDNESAPTQSPVKLSRIVKVKTLEEIRLERIQAESAAYYSYPDTAIATTETADDLRKRIIRRLNMKTDDEEVEGKQQEFEVLSLNEIRNRKKKFSIEGNIYADEEEPSKKVKLFSKLRENDLSQVKIKTLEEIRAERAKKFAQVYVPVNSSSAITQDANADHASSDSEVSSTSKCDTDIINLLSPDDVLKTQCIATIQPMKRLKRKLILAVEDPNTVKIAKFSTMLNVESSNTTTIQCASPTEVNKTILDVAKIDAGIDIQKEIQSKEVISDNERGKDGSPLLDSNKLDEVLLLDEEEFESNDILKAEEDILKDIDELLNE